MFHALRGLEEDKITGFSNHDVIIEKLHMGLGKSEITEFPNVTLPYQKPGAGLEENRITGLSIRLSLTEVECIKALEVEEIAGHSNACYTLTAGLEEDKIT